MTDENSDQKASKTQSDENYSKHCLRFFLFLVSSFLSLNCAYGAMRLDRQEVEAWADEYYGTAVAEHRGAAIAVTVVQDGEVLLQKGYGYHDYGTKRPMDPETSGVTVGSITKTFVATAIAQLVDRGLITSLDDPANKYLKRIQLPGRRGQKVTLRHLLNHRAGFADVNFGFLDKTAKDVAIPLTTAEIMRFMPGIVMEPGGRAVYSNWGFSILGFIVEDITGERMDDYLKRHIFAPLGMAHTSLIYGAFPDNLTAHYRFTNTGEAVLQQQLLPHPWVSLAGALVTTSADMARYMNAHLFAGKGGTVPLLSEKMFEVLHTERYRNAPIFGGLAHTFWTFNIDGAVTIEHGGGAPAYQSMMTLIPELKIGFFASAMQSGLVPWESYGDGQARTEVVVKKPLQGPALRESFVDRFFTQKEAVTGGPKSDLQKLVGYYYQARRPYHTLELLAQAFHPAAVLEVSLNDHGNGVYLNGRGPFKEIGNGIFANASGSGKMVDPYTFDYFNPPYIAFNLAADGTVIDLVPGADIQVWQPVGPIFNPHTMLKVLVVLGALAATGLLLWLWSVDNWFRSLANWLSIALGLAVVAIPWAMFVGFAQGDSLMDQMATGEKGRLWIIVIAANAIALLALLLLWACIGRWRQASEAKPAWVRMGYKLHLALITVAAVLMIPALNHFNLIGVHMPG